MGSSDQDIFFNTIKQFLLKNIPLYNFDNDLPIFIRSDASHAGAGAYLFNKKPGEKFERIIEFYSKTWSKSEINYEILHKEMAAQLYCLRYWRHRILGKPCTLFTDCIALVERKNIKNPQDRLAKFCLFFTHFGENLTLKYLKGKRNIVADYFSRCDLNAAPKEDL